MPLGRPTVVAPEASAFAGLLDLVFATFSGVGETSFAFAGLLALVLVFSIGAGDLLAWRVGAFAGLFDRLLRPMSDGWTWISSAGLRDLALGLPIGAGDLLTVRVAGFFGLWLRARMGLLSDASRSRLAGLLAGLLDREAARLDGLVTRPANTWSILSMYSSWVNPEAFHSAFQSAFHSAFRRSIRA